MNAMKKGLREKRILNPCRKCLIRAACNRHKSCDDYQNWIFKRWLCKHVYAVEPVVSLHLPTSIIWQCEKCRKIK